MIGTDAPPAIVGTIVPVRKALPHQRTPGSRCGQVRIDDREFRDGTDGLSSNAPAKETGARHDGGPADSSSANRSGTHMR